MKVYICADFSQDGIELLKVAGHEVKTGGWGFTSKILDEDELIADIGDAEVLVVGYEPVTKKVLDSTNLKIISSIRGGPGGEYRCGLCDKQRHPGVFYVWQRGSTGGRLHDRAAAHDYEKDRASGQGAARRIVHGAGCRLWQAIMTSSGT